MLSDLDLSLYAKIECQLEENDKRSLLACQLAARDLRPAYNYLEIGSYLGGSIQPHLLDESCAKIYSIDKRPETQPDERGVDYTYLNNSTARMLGMLSEVDPDAVKKIVSIDGDTRELSHDFVTDEIDLCFIDGEHTDEAAISDFKFCLDLVSESRGGAIIFHDATTVYNGIAECVNILEKNSIKFRAYSLPAIVFVVEIGDFPMHKNPAILNMLTNNHKSYLYSLQYNDYYRQFANKKPFRIYKKFLVKWRGLNRFD